MDCGVVQIDSSEQAMMPVMKASEPRGRAAAAYLTNKAGETMISHRLHREDR